MPGEKGFLSLVVAVLVLGTANYLPYQGTPSAARAAAAAHAAPSARTGGSVTPSAEALLLTQTYNDAVSLIAEHIGTSVPPDDMWTLDAKGTTPPPEPGLARLHDLQKRVTDRGVGVDFVIATLPDPIDSNARWQFDPMYDALQRAIAASGYVLDRFYIPDWDATGNPDTDQRAGKRLHERLPGVVLFQKQAGTQLLVVFLVFETATGGVHQVAFHRAVWTAANWSGARQTIRVLGPTFSGSIPSLGRAILEMRRALATRLHFRIVSGAATNDDNQATLAKIADDATFRTTVLPDRELLGTLHRFLETRVTHRHMAVLVESNTAYGDALRPMVQALCEDGCAVLPFPLHISRLRGTADAAQAPAAPGSRAVPLSLDEPLSPTDQIPSMAPRLTSASTDVALTAILDTIERENIAAIGLFATDARDKLFLAQQISLHSPDTVLFTLEGDMLLAHADFRRYTYGMLIASSYPLFSETQRWNPTATSNAAPRQQFGSTNAQGMYNAAISLLNYSESGEPIARGDSTPPPPLLDYRQGSGPYGWISAVGQNGIWPLHRDTAVTCGAGSSRLCEDYDIAGVPPAAPIQPAPWLLTICVAFEVFALLHVWWWIDARARHAGAGRLLAASSALALLTAQFAALLVLARYQDVVRGYGPAPAAAAIMMAAAAIWGLMLGAACTAFGRSTRAGSAAIVIGLLAGAAAGVAIGAFVVPRIAAAALGDDPLLLLNRGLQPFSGLSPFLPVLIILIALYAWPTAQLARITTPTLTMLPGSGQANEALAPLAVGGFVRLVGKARDAIVLPVVATPAYGLPVFGVVAATAALALMHNVQTTEDRAFDAIFLGGWLLLQAIVCVTIAEHLRLWRATKELLKGLAVHPMAEAFARVPRDFFSNRLPPRGPRLIHLQHAINAYRALTFSLGARPELAMAGAGSAASAVHADLDGALREAMTETASSKADRGTAVRPAQAGSHVLILQASLPAASLDDLDRELQATPPASIARSATWRAVVDHMRTLVPRVQPLSSRALPPPAASEADRPSAEYAAEVFLAVPIALIIRELTARVVRGLYALFAALVLLLAYQSSFPAYPRRAMLAVTWVYVLAGVTTAVATIVSAERDAILSRLAGTPPGRIQWDSAFIGRTVIPLLFAVLTLFAIQFPEAGDALMRWLKPVQTALP